MHSIKQWSMLLHVILVEDMCVLYYIGKKIHLAFVKFSKNLLKYGKCYQNDQ